MNILLLKHKNLKDYFSYASDEINLFGQHILGLGVPYNFTFKDFDDNLEWQTYNQGQVKSLSVDFMKRVCGREFNPGDFSVVFFCFQPTEQGTAGIFTSYGTFECNGAIVSCIPITLADANRLDQWLWRVFYHEFVHCCFGILKVNWKVAITDIQDPTYIEYRKTHPNATEDQMTALSDSIFNANIKPYLNKLLAEPPQKGLALLMFNLINALTAMLALLKTKPKEDKRESVVTKLAHCIALQEGFYGSINNRARENCNPGNIMWCGQSKSIGKDDKGFAIFACDFDGWENLEWQLNYILSGKSKCYKPDNTIKEFVEIWASTSPENEKIAYANVIAKEFGCSIDTKLNELFK